jgi:cytochrome c oxidase cbb3-type subunit III
MKLNKIYLSITAVIFSCFFRSSLFSQQTQTQANNLDTYAQTVGLLVLLGVLVMFILIIALGREKYQYEIKKKEKSKAFAKVTSLLTGAVPLEQEKDIMFEHDFDGIHELDNKVPPWFNVLFYGSIIFAGIYLLVFHVFHLKPLMIEEYADEVRVAQMQQEELIKTGALINENTVVLLKDAGSLDAGQKTFMVNCIPCHGQHGEGTVGPNLTDDYWIHGGGIKNIFHTIKVGVPEKGMITWSTLLSPKQIQEVASYVISLHGTNPPNGKPPDGQKWEEKEDTTVTKTQNDSTSKIILKDKTDSLKIKSADTLKNKKSNK